jgi:hypothetical protein
MSASRRAAEVFATSPHRCSRLRCTSIRPNIIFA